MEILRFCILCPKYSIFPWGIVKRKEERMENKEKIINGMSSAVLWQLDGTAAV